MKFVCERCHTRYSIADDKVRQKILKIRCKTCENVITVRDPGPSSAEAGGPPAPPHRVPPPAPRGATVPPAAREWFVAVNGEQTGPLTRADAARRVVDAKADDDIYVWKDGLDGWKPPSDVPAIHQEVSLLRGRASGAGHRLPPPPSRIPTGKGAPVRTTTPPTGRVGRGAPPAGAMAAKPAHGGRASHATASLAEADPYGDDEHTQIQPFDAALLGADMMGKPAAGAVLPFKGKGGGRVSNGSGARAVAPAGNLDGLFGDLPPAAGQPVGAFVAAPGLAGMRAESGLSRLTGVPGFLSRNPSLKFIAAAAVVLVLIGLVIVVLVLPNEQKIASDAKPSSRPRTPEVSEARARAEAEQKFRATVADNTPPPVARNVAPDPRTRPRPRPAQHAAAHPQPLEPSPLTPDQAAPVAPTGKVSQGSERKVTEYRSPRGAAAAPVGGPSDAMIAAVVKKRENQAAIKTCYERALKRDDRLRSGRIDVSASVGMSGTVKAVVLQGPPEFVTVESCIKTAVRRWSFPVNSEEYKIEFPLILQGNL
jgi:predicted Zn finger-like uncharacterized protein